MKKKSLVMLVSAAVLLVSAAIGTVAYFTDSATVVNTFTVGKVSITLDEAKVNEEGQPVDAAGTVVTDLSTAQRVFANSYRLVPGKVYTKDPTLTVGAPSEQSYVRMLVKVSKADAWDAAFAELKTKYPALYTSDTFELGRLVTPHGDWQQAGDPQKEDNTYIYEFRYKQTVDHTAGKLPALFESFTIPGEMTALQLDTLVADPATTITIEAHAIQATGFTDDAAAGKTAADAAWEAFDGQVKANTPGSNNNNNNNNNNAGNG